MKIEVQDVQARLVGEVIYDGKWKPYAGNWWLIATAAEDKDGVVERQQQALCSQSAGLSQRADYRNLTYEIKVESKPAGVRHTSDGLDLAPAIDAGLHFIENGLVCGHYKPLPSTSGEIPPELARLLRGLEDLDVTVIEIPIKLPPRPEGSEG